MSRPAVRSNMGLVHALSSRKEQRAVCGTTVRDSWNRLDVPDWSSEPHVCRSCDDVVMLRGRKAAE